MVPRRFHMTGPDVLPTCVLVVHLTLVPYVYFTLIGGAMLVFVGFGFRL